MGGVGRVQVFRSGCSKLAQASCDARGGFASRKGVARKERKVISVKCSGKLLVTVMGIILSGSVGFGATVTVDGVINAGEYDVSITDFDPVDMDFKDSASDIEALHFGVTGAWLNLGMTVRGPLVSPKINTTGDGTGAFAPTSVSLSLSQGGAEKHSIHALMFFGSVLNVSMWDSTTPIPTVIDISALQLKAVDTGLEIAIHASAFTNLNPLSPFQFDLLFDGGGTNEDDRIQGTVPEPATMSMILIGGLFTLVRRRRAKR